MNKLFCPISNSIKFEKIFSIKNFPIFMGVVNKNFKPEFKDLNFWINRSSGTVQIYPRVPLKKLYFKSHGSGKIGKTWGSHHKTFFNLINKYKKSNILEIGGGDNSYAFKADKKTLVTSIEVNPKKNVNNQNHILIKGFFDKPTIKKHKLKNFDMVVHSHLFEHIYDLNKFLRLIYSLLIRNGYHIFSIPNILLAK